MSSPWVEELKAQFYMPIGIPNSRASTHVCCVKAWVGMGVFRGWGGGLTSIRGHRGDLEWVRVTGADRLLLILRGHLDGLTHIWQVIDDQLVIPRAATARMKIF